MTIPSEEAKSEINLGFSGDFNLIYPTSVKVSSDPTIILSGIRESVMARFVILI